MSTYPYPVSERSKLALLGAIDRRFFGDPITVEMLAKKIKIPVKTGGPTIRRIINALRTDGFPIANHPDGGYFMATDPIHLAANIESLQRRIYCAQAALNGLNSSLTKMLDKENQNSDTIHSMIL
jgi:hypothetical protein